MPNFPVTAAIFAAQSNWHYSTEPGKAAQQPEGSLLAAQQAVCIASGYVQVYNTGNSNVD